MRLPKTGVSITRGAPRDLCQGIVAMDSSCQCLPLEHGYDHKADYERELEFFAA